MKKMFKILTICTMFVCCLITSGCSCAKPMNISYTVKVTKSSGDDLEANIDVFATLTKKFREPIDTPCYKKMEKGYIELTVISERYQCYTSDCYKKVGRKEYEKMTKDDLEVSRCIAGEFKCYEYVENTYYKLLKNPEGISECYDADGNYFERATYDLAEKVEVEKSTKVISTTNDKFSYNSNSNTIPNNKNYSYIYDFRIKNNENQTMYIEALDFGTIIGENIKEESAKKIKITQPSNIEFIYNKFYYVIDAKSEITVTIEIKNLLTSDTKEKTKDLNMNILITVK